MVKTIVLIITVGKREFKGRAKAAVFSCKWRQWWGFRWLLQNYNVLGDGCLDDNDGGDEDDDDVDDAGCDGDDNDGEENLGWMGSQSGRGGLVIAYGSLKENVLLLFGHFGFAYLVMY